MTTATLLVVMGLVLVWLLAAWRLPQHAVWFLLLWVPVQGWFQLNVFNDSSATVLLYEFQILGIYLVFAFHAMRFPEKYGPPGMVWFAVPFTIWALLFTPRSVELNGAVLTAMGLRTYLLPLPLVWIGYRTFTTRVQVENLGGLLMLQLVLIAGVTAAQFGGYTSASGASFAVPLGYVDVGVVRPPGTFSAAGHLGMYVLFSVLFGFGLLGLSVPFWKRAAFAIGLASATVALIVNTQRATIVLLAATIPLMLLLARQRRGVRTTVIALAVAAAAGMIGGRVAGDAFVDRFVSIADDINSTLNVSPMRSFTEAMRTPLIGEGLGIAVPGAGRFMVSNFAVTRNENVSVISSEQFMAALVSQTGVPGLLLFYLFIGAIMHRGLRAVRACRRTDLGLFAAAIFSYQVAICLQSWSYDPLHFPPSRVLFWFWAGALMSLPRFAATAAVREPAAMPRRAPVLTRRLVRPPRPPARRPSVA